MMEDYSMHESESEEEVIIEEDSNDSENEL